MWAELADNVSRQLDLAEDPASRPATCCASRRCASTRMGAVEAAIEIYREVL